MSKTIFDNRNSYREHLEQLDREIVNYNSKFIVRRLSKYSNFFEGKDDDLLFPLDEYQRKAIIKDDLHNLVIAGAGSGKTSVITSRIVYLIRRKDNIKSSRILALAYTKTAAQEMQERIKRDYKHDIAIKTFHSLGLGILREKHKVNPRLIFSGENQSQLEKSLFSSLLDKLLTNKQNQELFFKYIVYHNEEEKQKTSFNTKEEYYEYMKSKQYVTLNNISVKSYSEREIANFLFTHDIKFEYEPLVEWIVNNEDKEYHPDFYLPEYDHYIEHWGLDSKKKVPEWFSISSEEYNNSRDWKLCQFQVYEQNLIETWEYWRKENKLIDNLKTILIKLNNNLEFERLSYNELVEKTYEFKEKYDEVINLVINFIKIAKSNMLNLKDISRKIGNKSYSKFQNLFAKIALGVYELYESELAKQQKIDFDDMINRAVIIIKENPEYYQNKYDHILIDEFQDISYQRMELIKGFVNKNSKTKLFCVGDDWQSIYQFTGSNVEYFVEMDKFFPNPEVTHLQTNYRSTNAIVETSNHLIEKNKKKINKTIISAKLEGIKPTIYMISENFNWAKSRQRNHLLKKIEELLEKGIEAKEIMVISRFSKGLVDIEIYFGAHGFPVKEIRFNTAHGSKGSEAEYVFLIDIISGKYGFPCEINESSIYKIAKRNESSDQIEEERRLFYVAITRSKRYLYIYTRENEQSRFLKEIIDYVQTPELVGYVEFKKIKKDIKESQESKKLSEIIK